MLKDFRRIWSEDQYQLLGKAPKKNLYYFGRAKGGRYEVYLRSSKSAQRRWIQSVLLNQDWYWCSKKLRLFSKVPKNSSSEVKTEHVLAGYHYGCDRKLGLQDFSSQVKVLQQTLDTGAEVIWLIPKSAKNWILSLHGGPESQEGFEIRYGGLYRDLFRNQKAVAILNYRGSTGLKKRLSQQAWGHWKSSIFEDFAALHRQLPKGFSQNPESVFGVSFGGALALLLQKAYKIENTVLSSPLLDLRHQEERASRDFQKWFQTRFSTQDRFDLSLDTLCGRTSGKVHVFYSLHDEVLGKDIFLRLEKRKRKSKNWFLYRHTGSHLPRGYREMRVRFDCCLKSLLNY